MMYSEIRSTSPILFEKLIFPSLARRVYFHASTLEVGSALVDNVSFAFNNKSADTGKVVAFNLDAKPIWVFSITLILIILLC